MSNTKKHKDKGKFNNGLLDKIPSNLQNMWNRHNFDKGEGRKNKKNLEDKIADKELSKELVETGETIFDKYEYCNCELCSPYRKINTDIESLFKKYVINYETEN